MSLEAWLLFCLTEAVLCLTPGPAVLLVVSVGLTAGASAGLRASSGILAANAFYFVLSATSLGAIILASWQLFVVVKWLGAAYLVWLGLRMLVRPSAEPAPYDAPATGTSRTGRRPFALGFLTQVATRRRWSFSAPFFHSSSIPMRRSASRSRFSV